MNYIAFSLPKQVSNLIIYNFTYPLNILMIMSLFFYSILQLESKIIAIKKINICLLFKDFFQAIVFFSFYYIEKNKSKLTKREVTLLIEQKLDDKVVLSRQTLLNNPNKNLELKMQKDKEDIIRIILIFIVVGISDFFNEKLLYVFAPKYDSFREIYFIYFICLNYFSIYFSNKFSQHFFPLYKHQKLSIMVISVTSFLYFFIMVIIIVATDNSYSSILFLIMYSFPISIINGIKYIYQKQLLEKDYVSEHLILATAGIVKLLLHFFSNISSSNYFRFFDAFSNFFSENNFLFSTLLCSFIFIISSLLGDYSSLHILYILNPNFSLLATQAGIFLLFVMNFIYLIYFGGNVVVPDIFIFIILIINNFYGLVYNGIIILKFNGLDEYTNINLKADEQRELASLSKNCSETTINESSTFSKIETSK